jgi:hypothetical protein
MVGPELLLFVLGAVFGFSLGFGIAALISR